MSRDSYSIEEIARAMDADAFGDLSLRIRSAAEPQSAGQEDLAVASSQAYADRLAGGKARAALLWEGADWQSLGLEAAIVPRRPRYALASLTPLFDEGQRVAPGIHPSAVIDPSAVLSENVHIGPLAVIGPEARIGANCVIGPQAFVGWRATLGENSKLREHVSIGARVTIGARFIAQPGARIGGDGFSFVTPDRSGVEATRQSLGDQQETPGQSWARIHSLGAVSMGDDCEVGANSTIDSGTLRDTQIGDRTKIDNLVQIGHNCVIGTDCLLCGMVGLAGSVTLGNFVVLAGRVGVNDNVFVGDGVIAGGAAKIFTNVPAGRSILGHPATKMDTQIEIFKAMRRLPRALRDLTELKKAVFKDKDKA
ncbi:MAG: UDP-3-O-(3-hydroxymyristoyl)glucosamine N-acyltransferase [Pseudomonadota bacterium]